MSRVAKVSLLFSVLSIGLSGAALVLALEVDGVVAQSVSEVEASEVRLSGYDVVRSAAHKDLVEAYETYLREPVRLKDIHLGYDLDVSRIGQAVERKRSKCDGTYEEASFSAYETYSLPLGPAGCAEDELRQYARDMEVAYGERRDEKLHAVKSEITDDERALFEQVDAELLEEVRSYVRN